MTKQHSFKYRSDIDGLRALAIIVVVLYHAFPKFIKGGFVGVRHFFCYLWLFNWLNIA